uniref:Tellurium resistance protein n=1 Tax=Clostridioides difficile TaxID=1496 RepID=A0A381IC41_CLODI|nr:tellurium resistance protein [Clostridioides difficile]
MSVSLQKGQRVSLVKDNNPVKKSSSRLRMGYE